MNHEGGAYSLGLKTLQPGENVTLDIRDLRERQVPDAQGHTIPAQASRGQVNWSMRGPENHTLIGRSEQIDIARGISSTYSCMNCCPDSFYAGWVESDWQGFVGDSTLMSGFEQDANCYGYTGPPYNPWPGWDNTVPSVCSTNNGTTTGESPGLSTVQAIWTAYEFGDWESGGAGECNVRERNIIAEALCEALQSPASLSVISVNLLPNGTDLSQRGCELSQDTGIKVGVTFQVLDSTGNPVARSDMRPQEKVTDTSFNGTSQGDPVPDWSDIGPSRITGTSQYTNAEGRFLDAAYGFCHDEPFSTYKFKQQISILIGTRRFNVRTNNVTVTGTSVGHGSITNGNDIQKDRP